MVNITKERGSLPKYVQLSEWLKGMIEKGRYAVGERLPSEIELSQMCKLNRNTVRQAISQLVDEGLVVKKNGIGTFVTSCNDDKLRYSLKNITSLTVEAGFPAMLQESIIYDKDNIAVELLHSYYRGDKFIFSVESGKFSFTNIQ